MNVAVLSHFGHMECLSLFLELFGRDPQHHLTVYLHGPDTDRFHWMDLYRVLYPNVNVYPECPEIPDETLSNYDHVFSLTAGEEYGQNCPKLISIVHIIEKNQPSIPMLSLTPFVKAFNIYYTFPFFSPILRTHMPQKRIACIGYCKNDYIDSDTVSLFQQLYDYEFIYVCWGDDAYPALNNISNVRTIRQGLSAISMCRLIQECAFLMMRKHANYDRFSGQLSLAVSYEKPLLIDKRTADAYGLPGLMFGTQYTELVSQFPVSSEKYQSEVEKLRAFKQKQRENNKRVMQNCLSSSY